MKKERLYYLDLIKLIAVIAVFTIHYTKALESSGISFSYHILPDNVFSLYLGAYGVSLFFIVSGAVLMYMYWDRDVDLGVYFKKRFLGIYPMFWLAFALFFVVKWICQPHFEKAIRRGTFLFTLLGIDGQVGIYTPTFYILGEWFLTVIIVLYVLFPILKKLTLRIPWLTLAAFTALTLLSAYTWNDDVLAMDAFFFHRIPEFLFGMIFIHYIKKARWYMLLPSVAILMAFGIYQFPGLNYMVRIMAVGTSSFIVWAFLFSFLKGKWIEKLSTFANKYCYPIFLTHHIIMLLLLPLWGGCSFGWKKVLLMYVICVVLTLASSALLLYLTPKVSGMCRKVYEKL